MSQTYIPVALRRQVRERAGERCEYCLLPEDVAFFPLEPDHIIAEKHQGQTTAENLALACFDCNRFKGSDISSIDPIGGGIVALFNPRRDDWDEHFAVEDGRIIPLTAIERVTEHLLKFNLIERVEVRDTLAATG